MQRAHPEWSKAKAEAQAIVDFETAATELFVSALERGKALRPAALCKIVILSRFVRCRLANPGKYHHFRGFLRNACVESLRPLDSRRWPFAHLS